MSRGPLDSFNALSTMRLIGESNASKPHFAAEHHWTEGGSISRGRGEIHADGRSVCSLHCHREEPRFFRPGGPMHSLGTAMLPANPQFLRRQQSAVQDDKGPIYGGANLRYRRAYRRKRPGYSAPALCSASATCKLIGCTFSERKRRSAAMLPTLSNSGSSFT